MIVKDESHVIRRCLESVKPLIDYWVIVDTGSTDGTQTIIQECLKNIPGQLYERPWKNFGYNRSEALELAMRKGDYILFMDADDTLAYQEGFQFSSLTKDLYTMWRGREGSFSYQKTQLVRGNLPWRWIGTTHEYLDCAISYTSDILENVKYVSGDDGARSHDAHKYLKNIALLEEALKTEPNNSRTVFYLAESYRDAKEKGKALEWYQKRIDMKEGDEEIFWSKFQMANLLNEIGVAPSIVAEAYMEAHVFRPYRAEPLYFLVELYMRHNLYSKAYECLKNREWITPPFQKDILFNLDWIEDYGLLFEQSVCAYYIGDYQQALALCEQLIMKKNLPEAWREQAVKNRNFALAKITQGKGNG